MSGLSDRHILHSKTWEKIKPIWVPWDIEWCLSENNLLSFKPTFTTLSTRLGRPIHVTIGEQRR